MIATGISARAGVSKVVPRRSRAGFLVGLGVTLAALIVGMTTLILLSFGGTFTDYAAVTAQVPASSTAVQLNSPVEYRNVSVGKVASLGSSSEGGLVSLSLHLDPSKLASIPDNVRATVAPVSIFGNQYVVLEPPAHPATTTLRSGATILALQTGRTASLQSTLGDLDHLLIALHPGQLNAALTAVASSLQGQGTSLGQNLVKANDYLRQMQPLWPTVVADLQTLVPVADQVTASTPDIVGILSNSVAPSRTVSTAGQLQISQLLSGGAQLANQADSLLASIQQPFAVLTAASGPFLDDISRNPQELAQVLAGLDTWAAAWNAAESSGPYLNLTANVNVVNPADLALALLGGPTQAAALAGGLGAGLVDPPTYRSAAVPAPVSTASTATETALEGPSGGTRHPPTPVLAEPAQQEAVSHLVTGMTGQPPASAAISTLLLSPVLEHLLAAP